MVGCAGAADDLLLDEEGNPIEDDTKPKMPSYPRYDGLVFVSSHKSAEAGPNMIYPPPQCTPPECVVVPQFSMIDGMKYSAC